MMPSLSPDFSTLAHQPETMIRRFQGLSRRWGPLRFGWSGKGAKATLPGKTGTIGKRRGTTRPRRMKTQPDPTSEPHGLLLRLAFKRPCHVLHIDIVGLPAFSATPCGAATEASTILEGAGGHGFSIGLRDLVLRLFRARRDPLRELDLRFRAFRAIQVRHVTPTAITHREAHLHDQR